MHRASRLLLALAAVVAALLVPGTAGATVDPGWARWLGPTDAGTWVRAFGSAGPTFYAGTEGSGIYRSQDNGLTWAAFNAGLPAEAMAVRDIDAGLTSVTIATDGGIWKSSNGGAWQPLGQGVGADKLNGNVQTIIASGLPGGAMLAGVVGGAFRSSDGGATWKPSSTGMPLGVTVWSLERFSWVPTFLYAATSEGVYRSTNDGSSWSPVTDGLPTGTNILRVVVDPQNNLTWYAITSGEGVYRSTNGGLTWGPVNDGLGSDLQVRAIDLLAVAPSYSDVVIGTQNGLYVSTDKGVHWRRISNDGLEPHTITWAITTVPNLGLGLVAGTQGGGAAYRLMLPPVNTAVPTISGTLTAGETLTATHGTWEGTETIAYTFQWQRCQTASASSCADIEGETTSSYTLDNDADPTKRFRVVITAENAASPPGYTTEGFPGWKATAITGAVGFAPNTIAGYTTAPAPSVTGNDGTPQPGEVLTATASGWLPAATNGFVYRWYRCTAILSGCDVVATGASYTIREADVDRYLAADATGSNGSGSTTSTMIGAGGPVLPRPPLATSAPAVVGKPWVGQTLTRTIGSYTQAPKADRIFTTWQVCDTAAGDGCTGIPTGLNDAAYTPNGTQVGRYIRVRVEIDVNDAEAPQPITVTSPAVGPVAAAPAQVASTKAPAIGGLAVSTLVLTLNQGTWTGGPTLTREWQRCTSAGTGCVAIPGATGLTYRLGAADVGKRIVAQVVGVNGWGIPVTAASAPTAVVAATLRPTYVSGGKIKGVAKAGKKLTALKGTWQAVPTKVAYRFQWTRNGKRIKGATKPAYLVRKADKGKRIGCIVTAKNAAGTRTKALPARKIG